VPTAKSWKPSRAKQPPAPVSTAEFVKVTDIKTIMAFDVLATPALVIDEKLVSSGRIPSTASRVGAPGNVVRLM
jgi:hypothetical protein